jgi:hypothetical protein
MPPLTIRACILCEQARQEVLGKWTLLGFFGVAPNVRVGIADFRQPITLCFVFAGDQYVGKVRVSVRVLSPSGADVPGGMSAEGEFLPGRLTSAFFLPFQAVVPGQGQYTAVLTFNGQDIYRTTFEIIQGDVAAMAKQLNP